MEHSRVGPGGYLYRTSDPPIWCHRAIAIPYRPLGRRQRLGTRTTIPAHDGVLPEHSVEQGDKMVNKRVRMPGGRRLAGRSGTSARERPCLACGYGAASLDEDLDIGRRDPHCCPSARVTASASSTRSPASRWRRGDSPPWQARRDGRGRAGGRWSPAQAPRAASPSPRRHARLLREGTKTSGRRIPPARRVMPQRETCIPSPAISVS